MIKKNYYLFLAVMLAGSVAMGQELGIKGGLNIPVSDVSDASGGTLTKDGASGYHAGIFAKFKVAIIGINPEVVYSFQNIDYNYDILGNTGTISQQSAYLDIPVMLRFYLPAGLNIQAGPQFGFLMSAKSLTDGQDDLDIKEDLKGSNTSLNVGLGIDLPFGLDIYGRYNIGLSDINDVDGATESIKNSMIQISLAYSLKK